MKRLDAFHRFYPILGVVLALILILSPILIMLVQSLDAFSQVFTNTNLLWGIAYAILNSLACSFVSLILGLPCAYVLSRYKFPLKNFFRSVLFLAMAMPTAIYSLAMNAGPLGPTTLVSTSPESITFISKLQSFIATIPSWLKTDIAFVILNIPIIAVLVGDAWSRLDRVYEHSALSLGYSKNKAFITTTLPMLRSALVCSFSLSFIRCFTDLAIRPTGIAGTILNLDANTAAAVGILSALISLLVLFALYISGSKMDRTSTVKSAPTRIVKPGKKVLLFIYVTIITLAIWLPVFYFIISNFDVTTLKAYFTPLNPLASPVILTILLSSAVALVVAIIATFIGLRLCFMRVNLGTSLMPFVAPLAIGPCIIGFGYYILSFYLGLPPTLLQTTSAQPNLIQNILQSNLLIMALSHITIAIPVSIVVMIPIFNRIPRSLCMTSMSLGLSLEKSYIKTDRTILNPIVWASIVIIFAISLTDFGSVAFTGGVSLSNSIMALAKAGDISGAAVLSSILLAIYLLLFIIGASLIRGGEKNV